MWKKTRSFVSAIALVFAVMAFGPATSKAYAGTHRPYAHAKHYRYAAPYSARRYYPHRRCARVFVYAPYPHWIYRPVVYAPAPYYPPAAAYCAPY